MILNDTRSLRYPHNDWLLTSYDYGYLGATVFAFTLCWSKLHALRMSKVSFGSTKILFQTGAFSFVVLALMMTTDNIMVYASFFGNLQFAILGLAYAGLKTQERDRWRVKLEKGINENPASP